MDKTKPFGLVMPKSVKTFQPKTKSIFESDSDDEPAAKKSCKIPQAKPRSKKIVKEELNEDPSIYEYDSIYDDMKAKQVAKIPPKENKPSRYIDSLLKAAGKRKTAYERRVEKKVHVEREKEGDEFKDKEAFVTSAYKKKMQELEEEEEKERRENQLNEMMDVTKQKDLSGFYRHFLKQSVGEEKVPVFGEKFSVKQEVLSDSETTNVKVAASILSEKEKSPQENIDQDSDIVSSSDEEEAAARDLSLGKSGSKVQKSAGQDTNDISSSDKRPKFRGKASSRNLRKRSDNAQSQASSSSESSDNENQTPTAEKLNKSFEDNETDPVIDPKQCSKQTGNEKPKAKIDIFAKRTVAEVFSAAQARYFQRLAARSG